MDRILTGTGATVRLLVYDTAGDLADAGAGNGTATVKDSAGVAIAGSPFTATHNGTGTYDVSLPTTLTIQDTYLVTWTMPNATLRATEFEMVGTFLFTQADLRATDAVLTDQTTYPDALLIEARENAEQRFEEAARVSFTQRGERFYLDGTGTVDVTVPRAELHALIACTANGVTVAPTDVKVYRHGTLRRINGWPTLPQSVMVLVEHGYRTVPSPVRRAGLLYARSVLLRSALEQSDRATAVFTDIGGYRLSLAGRDGPTGLPEVDAVLAQFGRRQAGSFA